MRERSGIEASGGNSGLGVERTGLPVTFRLVFDAIHNGAMVTDAEGYVLLMNKPYGEFLKLDPEKQVGRHCTEVVDNTRMHIVARTGRAEVNKTQRIHGQDMVVQRIPIREDGNVVAVFGQVMFKDVRDVGRLASHLSLLRSKVRLYEQELYNLRSTKYTFESIVSRSPSMEALKQEALKASDNDYPVLITGESGTGKDIFAQAIHQAGPRSIHPFVRINCSAIPKDLMEAELFGYVKGAFTGAHSGGKPGKFELADQGTVFLDEIGELPLEMQPKLLRIIEDKEFERVGGTRVLRPDFRIIAATNRDLDRLVAEGGFRTDLFYRLNVMCLDIPPLRDRPEDIPVLARHFLEGMAREAGLSDIPIEPEAESLLGGYSWPGNVRELINVLERTLASREGRSIGPGDLPFHLRGERTQGVAAPGKGTLRETLERAEREALSQALRESGQNKTLAAKRLGIHRTLLYRKMKRHGLSL
jgi:transcriptional regulator with PAS, ATPase and Fis domain